MVLFILVMTTKIVNQMVAISQMIIVMIMILMSMFQIHIMTKRNMTISTRERAGFRDNVIGLAATKISAYYLNSIREQCPNTIIYTTKNTAQELRIADGIVTVDDSIPLFNPITILTALEQTILEIYTTPTTTEKSA